MWRLCVVFSLLAQPASELRFRDIEGGNIEVVAPLDPAQVKAIPQGNLSAEQGEAWLRLCTVDSRTRQPGPAMLGSYRRAAADLVFRPRFGIEPGRTYRAFFGPQDNPSATADYQNPIAKENVAATVVKVFPTAELLPANNLKFIIYFSQPMRGGQQIFNQIEILDGDGNAIPDTWLMDEIWDETGRILIIYIHPGRIKWGVVLREVFGPVLFPEHTYMLVVRGDMLDANGQRLGKDFRKRFQTSAEDRMRVDLKDWKVQSPKAGTTGAITLRFSKSLDHNSLSQFLKVVDSHDTPVAGSARIGGEEKSWSFTPAKAWVSADYRVILDGRLEDVAGNTPLRAFDMDLQAPQLPRQKLEIGFQVRSKD